MRIRFKIILTVVALCIVILVLTFVSNLRQIQSENSVIKRTSSKLNPVFLDKAYFMGYHKNYEVPDKKIREKLTDSGFSGNVLFVKDNKIVIQRSFGYANHGDQVQNSFDTEFQIGDSQKIFTHFVIMQLIQNNTISMESKLGSYFTGLKYGKKVSIRQLLENKTGLTISNNLLYGKNKGVIENVKKRMRNTSVKQSNQFLSEFLLIQVISKASGSSYKNNVNEFVVKKLNLQHVHFAPVNNYFKNIAMKYKYRNSKNVSKMYSSEVKDAGVPSSNVQIYASTTDLYNVMANILQSKINKNKRLVKEVFVKPLLDEDQSSKKILTIHSGNNASGGAIQMNLAGTSGSIIMFNNSYGNISDDTIGSFRLSDGIQCPELFLKKSRQNSDRETHGRCHLGHL